jgi:hypothetical protein
MQRTSYLHVIEGKHLDLKAGNSSDIKNIAQ